jgi:hypothetical protein
LPYLTIQKIEEALHEARVGYIQEPDGRLWVEGSLIKVVDGEAHLLLDEISPAGPFRDCLEVLKLVLQKSHSENVDFGAKSA